jgi:hypothetical protein
MESALVSFARTAADKATTLDTSRRSQDAIVLIGIGPPDQSNAGAELATLAHHLVQKVSIARVEYCFTSGLLPSYAAVQERLQREQARCLMLQWQLGIEPTQRDVSVSVWYCDFAASGEAIPISLFENAAILHVLMDKYLGALQTRSVERYVRPIPNTDSTDEPSAYQRSEALRALDQRIDAMLPSEYQGKTDSVSPQSMGSASIKTDEQGRVAWDEIWTSFCDLAMAGGPPHRGKLLEAVTIAEVLDQREKYEEVVAEIRRGIEMVTGLKTQ